MSEEKLILARARHGEIAAFEQLMTMYERRVYALALRSTGSPEDAADVVQEVFLRAWRSIESFRGDSGFSTWLFRITANLCIDVSRRKAAAPAMRSIDDGDESIMQTPDTAPTPEQTLEHREIRQELADALAELSQEHRQVVLLRDVSGLSYTEIAETLELNEGTVKSRLSRARLTLRNILIARGNLSLPSTSKQTRKGDVGK